MRGDYSNYIGLLDSYCPLHSTMRALYLPTFTPTFLPAYTPSVGSVVQYREDFVP